MQLTDLNLLPVVHALLDEQHVTRAARRMHLSVPAASRALERARRSFDDPLLVRRGRGVVRTPFADELLPRLSAALDSIEAVSTSPPLFEPQRLRRGFIIRSSDVVMAAIGGRLSAAVTAESPRSTIRFEAESGDEVAAMADGRVDLAIGSFGDLSSEIEASLLVRERLVGALPSSAHRSPRTLRSFAALDHVVVSRRSGTTPVDAQLAAAGLQRRVVATVPSYMAALAMVAGSSAAQLTTIVPATLAGSFGPMVPVRTFDLPLASPEVDVVQAWHQRSSADPAHRWLRTLVDETVSGGAMSE
jgi:DNA-binding transcriptional LysR family regulator